MNGRNCQNTSSGQWVGGIVKLFVWLMIGLAFRKFFLGRLIVYTILGSILIALVVVHKQSEKKSYTSMTTSPLLRKSKKKDISYNPASVIRKNETPHLVKMMPVYDQRGKESAEKKQDGSELVAFCCKNCGASELMKVEYGIYSCVYCGTIYRPRDFRG